jgi:hypothetical protein
MHNTFGHGTPVVFIRTYFVGGYRRRYFVRRHERRFVFGAQSTKVQLPIEARQGKWTNFASRVV